MISPDTKSITVLSVSFYSSFHLKRLFTNLVEKADHPENIQFLIVDNANGKDKGLKESLQDVVDLTIVNNDSRIRQRSKSHASALDLGLKNIETEFTLIVDPDIYVFKSGWDTFCITHYQKMENPSWVHPTLFGSWERFMITPVWFLCFLKLRLSKFLEIHSTLFLQPWADYGTVLSGKSFVLAESLAKIGWIIFGFYEPSVDGWKISRA